MNSRIITLILLLTAISHAVCQSIVPVKKNKYWGYIDTSGKLVRDFQFTNPGIWNGVYYAAKKNKDLYFIYENGRSRFIENCDEATLIDSNHYIIKRSGRYFFADSVGKEYHNTGFERIQSLKHNDERKSFMMNGRWGICDLNGNILVSPIYNSIKGVCSKYYRVEENKNIVNLICETKENNLIDSVTTLTLINSEFNIFLCRKFHNEYYLIDGTGKNIAKGNNIQCNVLLNNYMEIKIGKKSFLYDLLLQRNIPDAKPPFTSSALKQTVKTADGYYNRLLGNLNIPKKAKLFRLNAFVLCYADGKYGLLDSSFKAITEIKFTKIEHLKNSWFLVYDSSLQSALFNVNKQSIYSQYKYSLVVYDTEYIKAYDNNKGMDLYALENDTILSVTPFENVIRINVGKTDEDDWLYDASGNSSELNSPSLFSTRSSRKHFWYSKVFFNTPSSITLYGLRYKDTVSKTFKKLLPPIFNTFRVLSRPNLSIATYQFYSISTPAIIGYNEFKFSSIFALVDDNTGKFYIRAAAYIDREELNANARIIRAFTGNLMSLHDMNTGKVIFRSTYITTETSGFRGVYIGGKYSINCGRPGTQIINDKMNPAIGFTLRIKKDIENFGLQGGEWRVFRNGNLQSRIPENGKNIIVYLEPMQYGTSIYMLNNGRFGLMDSLGNCIIKPVYDYITRDLNTPELIYCGTKHQSSGLISVDGEIITPPVYDQIMVNGNFISALSKNNFILNIFKQDTINLPLKTKVIGFENNAGFIKTKKGYHTYTSSGNIDYTSAYMRVTPFHNGHAAVLTKNGWGIIDSNGTEVISSKFKEAHPFGYTAAVLGNGKKLKFILLNEKELKSPLMAHAVEEIQPDLFVYKRRDKYGIFNGKGRKIIGFKLNQPPTIVGENIIGITNNHVICKNIKTGIIRTFKSENRIKSYTEEQLPLVYNKNSIGRKSLLISKSHYFVFTGDSISKDIIVPLEFNDRIFTMQKKYLFEAWRNDIYLIKNKNLYLFMNGMGQVNEQVFLNAEPMHNGTSIVRNLKSYCGLLGNDMAYKIQPWYGNLFRLNDSLYGYSPGYKWDIFQPFRSKVPLIENIESYEPSPNGMVRLTIGNKLGYVRKDGRLVWNLME